MPTVESIIKRDQPEVYAKLMAMRYVLESEKPQKSLREIERLMDHDHFKRTRGFIKQIRRG